MIKYRNPYIATFFSFLILFVSCQKNDDETQLTAKNVEISLQEFADKHIELVDRISEMLRNEENIDIEMIQNNEGVFNNIVDLEKFLQNAKIENYKNIANGFNEIQNNVNSYLLGIEGTDINIESIINLAKEKIDEKLIQKTSSLQSKSCGSEYNSNLNKCTRNYTIALAGVAISAAFTLGIGTVIGASVAGGIYLGCVAEAKSEFSECVANK